MQAPIYVIGDIHGQLKKLVLMLQRADLIDHDLRWIGGNATLWFLGDFVDRGPDGITVIDFVMRLQGEASAMGGLVQSLQGNHELLLLAAYRFGRRSTGLGSNFLSRWKRNGGNLKDLKKLTLRHLDWLSALPAMARVGQHLLLHADAPLYIKYGSSIEDVNANFQKLITRSDALAWEELLEDFARRGAFHSAYGEAFARRILDIYGGQQLIHGHTPISVMVGCPPQKVIEAWTYANGLCINVDSGLFLGSSGFIYQLPTTP